MNELMIQVERVVRPLRASGQRKDRLREELLAHLTCIYEEELARCGEAGAARAAAVQRFGAPAELTRALQDTVSFRERKEYALERWLTWQAPEKAARFTLRLALLLLGASTSATLVLVALIVAMEGTGGDLPTRVGLGTAFVVVSCIDVFLLGLLYFKIRDRLCGAPWAVRSRLQALAWALLFSVIVFVSGLAVPLLGTRALEPTFALLPFWYLVSLVMPLFPVLYALVRGPAEIRHTEWACLDIGG
jgi:hypothetical protein